MMHIQSRVLLFKEVTTPWPRAAWPEPLLTSLQQQSLQLSRLKIIVLLFFSVFSFFKKKKKIIFGLYSAFLYNTLKGDSVLVINCGIDHFKFSRWLWKYASLKNMNTYFPPFAHFETMTVSSQHLVLWRLHLTLSHSQALEGCEGGWLQGDSFVWRTESRCSSAFVVAGFGCRLCPDMTPDLLGWLACSCSGGQQTQIPHTQWSWCERQPVFNKWFLYCYFYYYFFFINAR